MDYRLIKLKCVVLGDLNKYKSNGRTSTVIFLTFFKIFGIIYIEKGRKENIPYEILRNPQLN